MKILIEASDEDELKPQTATALLLLRVIDVNDHDPEIAIYFIEDGDQKTNTGG